MIILITGATHTGKTLLAQKLLEERKSPCFSIDHLKMGLIRSGMTTLTPEDVDSIINEITSTDPTEGADDINTLPDLPGGVLSDQIDLLNKYVEALQKNDREAAAKLFHPAILEAYDNDAEAMLYDLDQHLSLYGGKIKGWSTVDSGAVDQDDLNELNESLPVDIQNAEVHLIELEPEQGDAIEIFLLMVQTAEGWSLYYSY